MATAPIAMPIMAPVLSLVDGDEEVEGEEVPELLLDPALTLEPVAGVLPAVVSSGEPRSVLVVDSLDTWESVELEMEKVILEVVAELVER